MKRSLDPEIIDDPNLPEETLNSGLQGPHPDT